MFCCKCATPLSSQLTNYLLGIVRAVFGASLNEFQSSLRFLLTNRKIERAQGTHDSFIMNNAATPLFCDVLLAVAVTDEVYFEIPETGCQLTVNFHCVKDF